jgi:phosphate ABC transporter, phosphate-binding protein
MNIQRRMAAGVAACLIAVAVVASPIGASPARAAGEAVSLYGAGATFPAPLYKKWIEAYQKAHPELSINYAAVGSGEGISRFVTGGVDFAGSDIGIPDDQAAKVTKGVVVVPATSGMVVIAYNLPGFSGELRLPRDVYADIFAGKITRWNDPRIVDANPDATLPDINIALVVRLDGSGTTYTFTQNLNEVSPAWRTAGLGVGTLIAWPNAAMTVRGNEGVASRIKISEGAIGYLEYGFAKRLGLPVAALQNKAGQYVKPTEHAGQVALSEAVAGGAGTGKSRVFVTDPVGEQAYPIVTFSWLLFYEQYADSKKAAALRDFFTWGLTTGQSLSSDLGYIPLAPAVASQAEQTLASVR